MPDTRWIDLANVILGVACAGCFMVMVIAAIAELMLRLKNPNHPYLHNPDGSFDVPGLGRTMADGGEELPPKKGKRRWWQLF